MGFKIISNRDESGNFIASADYWTDEKIDELLKKYNPAGKLRLSTAVHTAVEEDNEKG
ncbi:hypothetical protein [Lactococcus termiticola]|uniref:UDP-N-acetylglucosamine 1-carboxyvinyltransferase n=1 Tax=Lactococcus termiticola TaxID=2169526 RepID=A0A2R5HDX5_9LACT|nr:hypothetical protein [Lactococcus termiticola]GBG96277.1 hypothetical protein NtB2_00388 [Lactococcus termiticola]